VNIPVELHTVARDHTLMSKPSPTPCWDEVSLPRFPTLRRSFCADVAAGLTGITTALLLRDTGYLVALMERGRVGGVDTGCTTAHLTSVVDARLGTLASSLGRDHAQALQFFPHIVAAPRLAVPRLVRQ
jgi:hypothetical protein